MYLHTDTYPWTLSRLLPASPSMCFCEGDLEEGAQTTVYTSALVKEATMEPRRKVAATTLYHLSRYPIICTVAILCTQQTN